MFVRTRIYVTNIDQWEQIGKRAWEFLDRFRPAATMVEVRRLINPETAGRDRADAVISGMPE